MILKEYFHSITLKILVTSCFLFYFLACLIQIVKKRRKNFPPGPIGLPIVGYFPFLTKNPHLKLMELSKVYGEVFSLPLGSEQVVILNGGSSIREAFGKPEFLPRPKNSAFDSVEYKSPFFLSGLDVWHEQRKIVVRSMKEFVLGETNLESKMQDEIQHFLEVMEKTNGEPVDLEPTLLPSLVNNIYAMIFGEMGDNIGPEAKLLEDGIQEGGDCFEYSATQIFFPWIKYVPAIMSWLHFKKEMKSFLAVEKNFRKNIDSYKENLDPSNPSCFVDKYLVEMDVRRKKDPATTLNDSTLLGIVMDLVGAGMNSIRTSMIWTIYSVAAYPAIQKAVKKEILDVLSPNISPKYMDHKRMPYTQAVILEAMRFGTPSPLTLLRCATADTKVNGYDIPKGTKLLANLWAPHHDPKNWEEPNSFKPERFLGPDGRVVKSNNFMPFSCGRRSCPGEAVSYMEIFLYLVSILQKFDLSFPEGFTPTFDSEMKVLHTLKPHKIRFLPAK